MNSLSYHTTHNHNKCIYFCLLCFCCWIFILWYDDCVETGAPSQLQIITKYWKHSVPHDGDDEYERVERADAMKWGWGTPHLTQQIED